METNFEIPELLIEKLQNAKDVAVLTGAGISAESGVPTFRGSANWAMGAVRSTGIGYAAGVPAQP